MGRRVKRVHVELNDTSGVKLSGDEIDAILRAADDIIDASGRNILVKILKGSKDKKVLELGLQSNPSYGYFSKMTLKEIAVYVDWMIKKDWLNIRYDYRLPLIVFSEKGWERYKPIYARERLNIILAMKAKDYLAAIEDLKTVNRQVIDLMLTMIKEDNDRRFIPFLYIWRDDCFKKIRERINNILLALVKSLAMTFNNRMIAIFSGEEFQF